MTPTRKQKRKPGLLVLAVQLQLTGKLGQGQPGDDLLALPAACPPALLSRALTYGNLSNISETSGCIRQVGWRMTLHTSVCFYVKTQDKP